MAVKRGSVYLATFNPSKGTEAGKIRPCLVIQTDLLNDEAHPSTTVLPLTTQLIDDAAPLRFRILARDRLQQDSDIMLDQARSIDNRRFHGDELTRLYPDELADIDNSLRVLLELG